MTAINISISMFTPNPERIAMNPPVEPVVATSTDPFLRVLVPCINEGGGSGVFCVGVLGGSRFGVGGNGLGGGAGGLSITGGAASLFASAFLAFATLLIKSSHMQDSRIRVGQFFPDQC